MAFFLLKVLFFTVNSLVDIASRIIFSGAAHLIVQVIHTIKVPREAINTVVQLLQSLIEAVCRYIWEFLMEGITSLLSFCFDLVKEAMVGAVDSGTNVIFELVEKTKTALDEMSKELPEVLEGLAEMIWNIVVALLNNSMNAIGYIRENA